MSTASSLVNGQLVPIAPANGVFPPSAGQPTISAGAGPNNLPNSGGGPSNPPAAQQTASNAAPNLPGVAANVWSLPFWQNPLALVLVILFVAYMLLRFVHWRG